MTTRCFSCLSLLLAASLAAQDSKPAEAKAQSKPTSQSSAEARKTWPRALVKTSMGDITVELFQNEAPKTVANFLGLANGTKEFTDSTTKKKVTRPYYDGLIFHRVIKGFMAQAGCPLGNGRGDPGYKFANEISAKALGLDKVKALENGRPHRLLPRDQRQFRGMVIQPLFRKLGITSQESLNAKRKELDKAIEALTLMDVYSNMGFKFDNSRPSHAVKRGTLAMANAGPNSNGSQFFITIQDKCPHLDGKHTVFGQVVKGMEVVDKMATVEMGPGDKPKVPIKILSIRTLPKAAEKK